MSSNRQDAWSQQEDELLATVVLESIANGQTQLDAFAIVGQKLKRTAAACGFRWNSYVRKLYENEILKAKKEKKENKLKKKKQAVKPEEVEELVVIVERTETTLPALEEMVRFVETLYANLETQLFSSVKMEKNETAIFELQEKVYNLESEKEELLYELNQIKDEYSKLVELINKAKSLVGNI